MKLSKLTLAVAATLGASLLSSAAYAIDLYVDTKTKQIYAEPGKGRVLMGKFVHVDEKDAHPQHHESENDSANIKAIKEDLELKNNAIKALEEKVVESREQKAKNDEKWFNKINLRGYTQLRYSQLLSGADDGQDRPKLSSVGDSGIGNNKNFSFRRVRLVFSGDVNDYVSLYIQPDFASGLDSSINNQHFAQLRDAYADLHFDKAHEYRIRAGQSKVPFGWENLQSSQNRLALDRNDALNSAVPSERDLGLMAYWTPKHVQKLWKDLSKKGLKTSGDYGVVGFGVYNGQGLNRDEKNDDLYMVAHTTYPLELGFLGSFFDGQVLEIGADAMSGRFTPSLTANALDTAKSDKDKLSNNKFASVDLATLSKLKDKTISEDRVAVHAILFPQPFGLQAEWNWGKAGTLDAANSTLSRQSLNGGYVQAMYKIDNVFGTEGTMIPYVKVQKYDGAWKGATNAPRISTRELEAGIEYQIMKALEITLAYSYMDRTNVKDLNQVQGDVLRAQLQWNY